MTIDYNKFETARLIGARALQIMMGAPVLVKVTSGVGRPLDIARMELEQGVLPITVKRREEVRVKKKKVIAGIPLDDEETVEKVEGPADSFDEEVVIPEDDED